MHTLMIVRHGESQWNLENRFTGWTDVDLSDKGREEARHAGQLIKDAGLGFDLTYTSVLKRAIRTLWTVLDELDLMWLPQVKSWHLNERHYGALQGLNKAETAEKYGDDQVKIWRRSYDVQPPALEEGDDRLPARDPRYRSFADCTNPATESLKDVVARLVPYWEEEIAPQVRAGKRVLIAAHGNSLRALVKYLDGLTEEEVLELNIPTGQPLVYELDDDLRPIRHYYLDNPEAIEAGVSASGVKK